MVDTVEFYTATGKRKNAIARVRMKNGTGKIIVNNKEAPEYFQRPRDRTRMGKGEPCLFAPHHNVVERLIVQVITEVHFLFQVVSPTKNSPDRGPTVGVSGRGYRTRGRLLKKNSQTLCGTHRRTGADCQYRHTPIPVPFNLLGRFHGCQPFRAKVR